MSLPVEIPFAMIAVPWAIGAVKYGMENYQPTGSLLNMVVYDTR